MTWLTNHLGLTGVKLASDNGTTGGHIFPGDIIPAASGQLLGGSGTAGSASAVAIGSGLLLSNGTLSLSYSFTLPTATTTVLGGVKVDGTSITISGSGVISANTSGGVTLAVAGVDPVPVASGTAAVGTNGKAAREDHVHPTDTSRLAAANNLSDVASAATVRTNLGLGGAAVLSVGTTSGTVAAGNDSRIVGALQAAAIPAAAGQLLGGSGTAGAAAAVGLGAGLSITSGVLNCTISGGSYPGIDGVTVVLDGSGHLSVAAISVTALTDISTLGGPALSDVDALNRAGSDYRTSLAARAALFRKTPAGSRTTTLTANSQAVTLTAADHDKTLVATGAYTGITLTSDGTLTDGFRCHVINATSGPLTFTGMTGYAAMKIGASATVTLANATLYVSTSEPAIFALTSATSVTTDASKSDTFSLTLATNGTLSSPSNLVSGRCYVWEITQDGTGSRTLAYGNLFTWSGGTAPALSTAPGAVDNISAFYDGSKLRALIGKGFA